MPPTPVTIQFVSCGAYAILDTDYNLPSYDVYLKSLKVIQGDPCTDVHDQDYGLRQVPSVVHAYSMFNIFPVAGEAPNIVYIQGVSRRDYCPSRSFLQWTEESCKLSTPHATSPATNWWSSSYHDLAHISLVGEADKSKWELKYEGGTFCLKNYIRPFNVPADHACAGKYLSIGSSTPAQNALQIGIGAKNVGNCQLKLMKNGEGS